MSGDKKSDSAPVDREFAISRLRDELAERRLAAGALALAGFDDDHPLQAVAGVLASSVAGQLATPLRALRENLAIMVESLDSHIGKSEGPDPYPWKSITVLRQQIADSYLLSRETARLASELFDAINVSTGAAEATDVNRQIEAALELTRHRLAAHTEMFVDLGSIPPVRAVAGELTLAVAKVLLTCAASAHATEGSAISVKSRLDREDGVVVIYIADNGCGTPRAAEIAHQAIAPIMRQLGGSFDAVAESGRGSVYEFRLPTD